VRPLDEVEREKNARADSVTHLIERRVENLFRLDRNKEEIATCNGILHIRVQSVGPTTGEDAVRQFAADI
jgi:hypothetical protein